MDSNCVAYYRLTKNECRLQNKWSSEIILPTNVYSFFFLYFKLLYNDILSIVLYFTDTLKGAYISNSFTYENKLPRLKRFS